MVSMTTQRPTNENRTHWRQTICQTCAIWAFHWQKFPPPTGLSRSSISFFCSGLGQNSVSQWKFSWNEDGIWLFFRFKKKVLWHRVMRMSRGLGSVINCLVFRQSWFSVRFDRNPSKWNKRIPRPIYQEIIRRSWYSKDEPADGINIFVGFESQSQHKKLTFLTDSGSSGFIRVTYSL